MAHTEENLCAYGSDHPAEKFMSGTPICWKHWWWVKADFPAAECWSRLAEEFLSKIDQYDLLVYFQKCDISEDEVNDLIGTLSRLQKASEKIVEGV